MDNEKLEKLNYKCCVVEKKLTAAQHKEKQLWNELKKLPRSKRTQRLYIFFLSERV